MLAQRVAAVTRSRGHVHRAPNPLEPGGCQDGRPDTIMSITSSSRRRRQGGKIYERRGGAGELCCGRIINVALAILPAKLR